MTISFMCTRYDMRLGDYDAITGIPAIFFLQTPIKMAIQRKGESFLSHFGIYTSYATTGFCCAVIKQGDYVKDDYGDTYLVNANAPMQEGDYFGYYLCELVKTPGIPDGT